MKKLLLVALFVMAAVAAKAEIVSRDTVEYNGGYHFEKIEKRNDYGEVSVRYVVYLEDILNSKGEARKVTVNKATFEQQKITHVVYNNQDTGARKIAKAIAK